MQRVGVLVRKNFTNVVFHHHSLQPGMASAELGRIKQQGYDEENEENFEQLT